MMKTFGDKETEKLYITGNSKKYPQAIIKTAIRKLDYLNAAKDINDLEIPPGNKLELLKEKYNKMYSIRINKQFRIIFLFKHSCAINVAIIDYH
ncbi:toxin HigB-1 [bacterium BMS3Abin04]|nr:toxin HigB-1 [bacterium BMS3Abin04]